MKKITDMVCCFANAAECSPRVVYAEYGKELFHTATNEKGIVSVVQGAPSDRK